MVAVEVNECAARGKDIVARFGTSLKWEREAAKRGSVMIVGNCSMASLDTWALWPLMEYVICQAKSSWPITGDVIGNATGCHVHLAYLISLGSTLNRGTRWSLRFYPIVHLNSTPNCTPGQL